MVRSDEVHDLRVPCPPVISAAPWSTTQPFCGGRGQDGSADGTSDTGSESPLSELSEFELEEMAKTLLDPTGMGDVDVSGLAW